MKLLKMSGHDCLLYSAAMILDESPDTLEKEIGHDGKEVWWPEVADPFCRRGIHIQEILDLCIKRGYVLYPVELMPASAARGCSPKAILQETAAILRFKRIINGQKGILITATHAVAWDGQIIFDPNGRLAVLGDYTIREAWLIGNQINYPIPKIGC